MGKKKAAPADVLIDEPEHYELDEADEDLDEADIDEDEGDEDGEETVTISVECFSRLEEADDVLERIEAAEAECDEALIVVEQARDEMKAAKGAYAAAVGRLRKLCRARKENMPLFDKHEGEQPEDYQPVNVRDRVTCEVIDGEHKGTVAPIWSVGNEGISILVAGQVAYLAPGEYQVDEEALRLIKAARAEGAVNDVGRWEDLLRRHLAEQLPAVKADGWRDLAIGEAGIIGNVGRLLAEAGYETLGQLSDLMQAEGQLWNKKIKGVGETGAAEIADRFAEFWADHPEYCQA
jgi:hypothetical protein